MTVRGNAIKHYNRSKSEVVKRAKVPPRRLSISLHMLLIQSHILRKLPDTILHYAQALVSESATSLSRFPLPSYLLSGGCSPAIIYPTPGAPYSVAPFVKAPCTLLHGAQALVSEVATSPFPGSLCPLIY